MTTTALNAAFSGLRTAQKALDVTSTNIANAGVEGYTRKTLAQETVLADGVGVGVRYGEIQRYVDEAVQRDYRNQLGVTSFLSTSQSYLTRVVATQGATDAETNIASQLSKLYDSFVNLSSDPNSAAQQASVISRAKTVVTSLNNYSSQLLKMRNETQVQLNSEVTGLNTSLQQIAALNKKIGALYNVGQSTADLEDQRDKLIKTVSQQLNVSYFKDGNNVVVLQTKDGHVLADTEARKVSFDNQLLTAASSYPQTITGVVIQDDTVGSVDLAAGSPGGSIGALLEMRDKTIPGYMAQADELAHKMMMRFDEQGMRLFTDHNGVVPANNPQSYVGIAANIQVNQLVLDNPGLLQSGTSGPAVNAGSNEVVMKVINYTFGRYKDASGTPNVAFNISALGPAGNLKFNIINDPGSGLMDFSRAMMDSMAADSNSNTSTLDAETQYTNEIQNRLLEGSAVNSDQEMVTMIDLQKSYSANARMISTLNELFRDLLNAI